MKLSFVEVCGFRGFKDKTRFDFPGGFAVLTGRNGVGKSTVLDAVDFVLTGTINKYLVKDAKGGGLDDHIWWVGEGEPESQYAAVGFVREDGREFAFTRSRERGLDKPAEEIARLLCVDQAPVSVWAETLMRTTLIRDELIAGLSLDLPEQARFSSVRAAIGGLVGPDYTKRTGALLAAASTMKTVQEGRVADSQAELGRTLGALTEARSVAERQADVAEADEIVKSVTPDLSGAPGDRAERLRRYIAERKQSISAIEEVLTLAESLQAERLHHGSEAGLAELAAARADYTTAQQAKERAVANLLGAQRLETAERESDAFASRMIALLNHGEAVGLQAGHCPLCGAQRSQAEFEAAIAAARSRLSARGAGASRAAAAVDQARLEVGQTEAALTAAVQRLNGLEAQRNRLLHEGERLAAILDGWNLGISPSDPESGRRLVVQRQEETARLEHALFILEGSGAHDRVAALEGRVELLRAQVDDESAKLTDAERAVEAARQIDHAAKEVPNQVLAEQFDTVMPLLKELYQRLRPHTDWREIEIDFGGRVRGSLNFTVGDGRNPQFLFSSGQRRAAGVAFLLAIHLSRPWCRLRALLLDDPVQHIDDYRALNLVEVLSAVRRSGRQVIVAVEDSALADLLCRRLRSTTLEAGRRFDLTMAKNGSAAIEREIDIVPLPREVLRAADA